GRELGVKYITSAPVEKLIVEHGKVVKLQVDTNRFFDVDYCIAGADYHHIEQEVLDKEWRMYDEKYWENRTMAPSSLLFYIGLNKKITGVRHHNLFFDRDFDAHAQEIYESPKWPSDPLFYLCCPSVTDQTVAPEGFENIFLLMPLAPGLEDNEKMREQSI
ncbi:MAG TPA: phytoene desaturase, partial [Saprospiraceae bacterium]|nr:phytoene desaturase [Saprospiraceae bacterium]